MVPPANHGSYGGKLVLFKIALKNEKSIGRSPPLAGCHKSGLPMRISRSKRKKARNKPSIIRKYFFFDFHSASNSSLCIHPRLTPAAAKTTNITPTVPRVTATPNDPLAQQKNPNRNNPSARESGYPLSPSPGNASRTIG